MNTEIIYCANACTTRHGDDWYPVMTEAPSQLCRRCEDRLHDWLVKIPDTYALLPQFVEPGSAEPDPDGRASKNPDPPAPLRLDVLDLLDTRLGRKWHGTQPAHDRRGVIGTLRAYVEVLIEERHLPTDPHDISVYGAAKLLDFHRQWVAEQEWVDDFYDDLRRLNRDLSDAVGDYRRPPVGTCPNTPGEDDTECGGPLFASQTGIGVHCVRCGHTWTEDKLAFLGRLQAEKEPAAATASYIGHKYGIKQSTLRTWADRGLVAKHGRNPSGQQLYDVAQTKALAQVEEMAG